MSYMSIGEAAAYMGVSVTTLFRILLNRTLSWEKLEKFVPAHRTLGQHRRYSVEQCNAYLGVLSARNVEKTICYARVSSHDQKADMTRQAERLTLWCQEQGIDSYEVITDLPGS